MHIVSLILPISKIMKNRLSIAMLLLVCYCTSYAQDPHFSQFFEAPLLRNPSLAGIFNGDLRINSVYRNQWGSVSMPYQTGSFDIEYKQPIGQSNDYITYGMEVLYDRAGTTNFTTSNILPAINYHKSLSGDKNKFLSVGFMGGYVQRRIDRSKVTTNNQYDGSGYNPALADGESLTQFNYHYWDGSVGASFNSSINGSQTDNYFIGIAYHHFNRPKNSFYVNPPVELNPRLVVSAGVKFGLTDVSYLTLDADVSKQGSYNDVVGGVMYSYKLGNDADNPDYIVHFGGYLRWKDAFIPVVKLDYNPFSLGFSYDANISQLKAASQTRGGFELSVSYTGFVNRGATSKDAILCPRF